jgi:hypothetical protein
MAGRFIIPVPMTAPAASFTSTPGAAWNAGGIVHPTSCIRLTK